MKKEKKKDKAISEMYKMYKLTKILDKNYFHMCIEIKENDDINWTVFYKNLPSSIYFSNKNKPLLTSDKNTIQDIYKLKDEFEKEKRKELEKNYIEYSNFLYHIFNCLNFTKRQNLSLYINILVILLGANLANIVTTNDKNFALLILVLTLLLVFSILFNIEKNKKEEKIIQKKAKESFIKSKIRQKGLLFLERLIQ